MWEPMANALGHGTQPIGWKEIHDIALNDEGWSAFGMPQWGKFRFGHTHPDFSNSGLISLIAEAYAGSGKTTGLTTQDVTSKQTGDYIEAIEQAVVHYGKSTGFFGHKMFENGPGYLSAAVLYENMVIESRQRTDLPFPIVAIYPKEGTFWSDHPVGIVEREWVTPDHREAGRAYIDFLLSEGQQNAAMTHGFRPGDPTIALGDMFSAQNGVDPAQPLTTLEVPEVSTIQSLRQVWQERKKKSHVVLAIDVSGSMKEQDKIQHAKSGARKLVGMLGDADRFTLVTFNNDVRFAATDLQIGPNRDKILRSIDSLFADGGTALYRAIGEGFDLFQKKPEPDRITSVVVLSDGADSVGNQSDLNNLLNQIRSDGETRNTRVFTIGYGEGANGEVLEAIANATRAKYFKGDTRNIDQVFIDISTFF